MNQKSFVFVLIMYTCTTTGSNVRNLNSEIMDNIYLFSEGVNFNQVLLKHEL